MTRFYEASTQMLNKDVAAHIAKFTSPFGPKGLDYAKADSVFQNAMVISPSAEVYFLNTAGKVIAFHPNKSAIKLWTIPLTNINKLIAAHGKDYLTGIDPRDPDNPKIFSASEVFSNSKKAGYIYVILGSIEYRSVVHMLLSSQISYLAIEVFIIVTIFSIVASLWYLKRLKRGYTSMMGLLENFENKEFGVRFNIDKQDELFPIKQTFNKMADLLVDKIEQLKLADDDRKNFIANISHDLRSPLAVARGFMETVYIKKGSSEITPQQQSDYIELSINKMQQVEKMVNQLFELSKIDSANFEPKKEPFIFSELLQEIINASFQFADSKNIIIDNSNCRSNAWILADISMIERVLQNLTDNAIKHTPNNGKVDISIYQENDKLTCTFINSGNLITNELRNWINDKNYSGLTQFTGPAKRGFGLIIIKKMLQLHDFTIYCDVTPGGMNMVSIIIPIHILQNNSEYDLNN